MRVSAGRVVYNTLDTTRPIHYWKPVNQKRRIALSSGAVCVYNINGESACVRTYWAACLHSTQIWMLHPLRKFALIAGDFDRTVLQFASNTMPFAFFHGRSSHRINFTLQICITRFFRKIWLLNEIFDGSHSILSIHLAAYKIFCDTAAFFYEFDQDTNII